MTDNAAPDVLRSHLGAGLIQCRAHGRKLGEDVDAVLSLGDHASETPDLALDSGEPAVEILTTFRFHIFLYPRGYMPS